MPCVLNLSIDPTIALGLVLPGRVPDSDLSQLCAKISASVARFTTASAPSGQVCLIQVQLISLRGYTGLAARRT